MIKIIKVSGFENEVVEKLSLMEEKRGLQGVSSLIYNKVVDGVWLVIWLGFVEILGCII